MCGTHTGETKPGYIKGKNNYILKVNVQNFMNLERQVAVLFEL